jgi:hypothetical protein
MYSIRMGAKNFLRYSFKKTQLGCDIKPEALYCIYYISILLRAIKYGFRESFVNRSNLVVGAIYIYSKRGLGSWQLPNPRLL